MNMAACSAMWLYLKIYVDRHCKSQNLGVASLKRDFGGRYDEHVLKILWAHYKKHAYLDKEDRIMIETKMAEICL